MRPKHLQGDSRCSGAVCHSTQSRSAKSLTLVLTSKALASKYAQSSVGLEGASGIEGLVGRKVVSESSVDLKAVARKAIWPQSFDLGTVG